MRRPNTCTGNVYDLYKPTREPLQKSEYGSVDVILGSYLYSTDTVELNPDRKLSSNRLADRGQLSSLPSCGGRSSLPHSSLSSGFSCVLCHHNLARLLACVPRKLLREQDSSVKGNGQTAVVAAQHDEADD